MSKSIDIWIDKDEDVFFEDYFEKDDVPKLKKFIEKELGYTVNVYEDKEREFKPFPAIWKKRNIRDIDWSDPRNIMILLKNEDKTNDEIIQLLGVPERESNFVVVTRMRNVRQQFKAWAKELGLDDSLDIHIEKFAKIYASKQRVPNTQIIKNIRKMANSGCKRLETDRFPECEGLFNHNCLKCQFNKSFIKDDGDVLRFNEILREHFF